MPLPTPRPGEGHDEFIERCMADPVTRREFPDADQRLAVCEGQWEGKENRLKTTRAWAQLLRGRRDWYRITNLSQDEAEVFIYDTIGPFGVTAADFVRDLRALKARRLTVRLNTPGGDVFDGIAIYTAIKEHPAEVEVRVDSLAASIGSVVAMAGDRVVMARHSTMMIHEPFALVIGDASDMRRMADVLDQTGDNIAAIYSERAGGSVREWRDRMRKETWLVDQEAVDLGLADEVAGESTAQNRFDLSIFRHPPEHLRGATRDGPAPQPTKREIERALRDAGLSHAAAKALLARGWSGLDEAREASVLEPLLETLRELNGGRTHA